MTSSGCRVAFRHEPPSTPSIDALPVFAGASAPLVIEAASEQLVTPSTAGPDLRVHGATPKQRLQLFVTFAPQPTPQPFKLPAPITGAGWAYVSLTDPLLPLCPLLSFLQPMADGSGEAVVRLPVGAVRPGVTFVVQAVDLVTLEVSEPVAVDLVATGLGRQQVAGRKGQVAQAGHQRAQRIPVDREALEGARKWLDQVTNSVTGRVDHDYTGLGPAREPGREKTWPVEKSEAMTGILCRVLLGADPGR